MSTLSRSLYEGIIITALTLLGALALWAIALPLTGHGNILTFIDQMNEGRLIVHSNSPVNTFQYMITSNPGYVSFISLVFLILFLWISYRQYNKIKKFEEDKVIIDNIVKGGNDK